MKIQSIFDSAFRKYGQILSGYDFDELLSGLEKTPDSDSVQYVPSSYELENTKVFNELSDRQFGGMPIQIGYCNGRNTKLNCLEYHRDSEVNIPLYDIVVLLGLQQDIADGKYNTGMVNAFKVPAGTAIELYSTTLHYAPCHTNPETGFKVACILACNTNTGISAIDIKNAEDRMLRARNKWLLAHPLSAEAREGAYVGLFGDNLDISNMLCL